MVQPLAALRSYRRAAVRAQQPAEIDLDWNCPWPLHWQRHYRVLADLVDADGHLPSVAPGVVFDGDDIGSWRWRQQEPGAWAQLLPEQRERLTKTGRAGRRPSRGGRRFGGAPSGAGRRPQGAEEGREQNRGVFQRGLAALAQWVEKEGQRPVPRGAVVEVAVDGEVEPMVVKLGVWLSHTKTRRGKLTTE
ncbi:helicase associated domain-containing protein [Streptomyces roseolus]|uniref:helicase associated domain-containing protein n=1 Tax=Streptomyces roseolus TaxID=67358 RepID=UPI0037A100A5